MEARRWFHSDSGVQLWQKYIFNGKAEAKYKEINEEQKVQKLHKFA
jgi:hypothetical protein